MIKTECKVINCKNEDIEYWTDGYCKACYYEREKLKEQEKLLEKK